MLKEVHRGTSIPASFPVDPTAEFEPGMCGQLKLIGNDIVIGVSDGTAPLGIIDDVRTQAFSRAQIDEVIEIPVTATELDGNGNLVNSEDVVGFLENANVSETSFISSMDVLLNPVNGAVTVPSGTTLNYDLDEDGTNDSFRIVVSYTYSIPGKPGDDSTLGSGRITLHYQRGFYATDQFDTRQAYPLGCTLYIGLDGKFTSRQPTQDHPGIAICTGPPGATQASLEILWL